MITECYLSELSQKTQMIAIFKAYGIEENSAVYTCIKKPKSFSHSGFSLKVARQLPLNTKKKRIEKPTSAAWFFETPPKL